MADLVWNSPAFLFLETIPEPLALAIFHQAKMLKAFPKMGGPLPNAKKGYSQYRQLVHKKRYRIIYEFDELEDTVYVSAVQSCKQRLPSPRSLTRQTPEGELPLE
jgi:mRNA-degrading endonuclease RelE of RelBE toxin-antitoxin system